MCPHPATAAALLALVMSTLALGPHKVSQPTNKKTQIAAIQGQEQMPSKAADRETRNIPGPNSKTITVGKKARRLKVPKSVNSYLLLDKVVPDAARIPDRSDINDFEDFLLAMRAGQRLTKEKFLGSRNGNSGPGQIKNSVNSKVAQRSIKDKEKIFVKFRQQKGS